MTLVIMRATLTAQGFRSLLRWTQLVPGEKQGERIAFPSIYFVTVYTVCTH